MALIASAVFTAASRLSICFASNGITSGNSISQMAEKIKLYLHLLLVVIGLVAQGQTFLHQLFPAAGVDANALGIGGGNGVFPKYPAEMVQQPEGARGQLRPGFRRSRGDLLSLLPL